METKVNISSFAAPNRDDIAEFESLTPEEQRLLIEAELEKGFEGEAVDVTRSTARDIFSRAMARVTRRMRRVELSPQAISDIEAVAMFGIEQFGAAPAELYQHQMLKQFDLLAEHPRLGLPISHPARF